MRTLTLILASVTQLVERLRGHSGVGLTSSPRLQLDREPCLHLRHVRSFGYRRFELRRDRLHFLFQSPNAFTCLTQGDPGAGKIGQTVLPTITQSQNRPHPAIEFATDAPTVATQSFAPKAPDDLHECSQAALVTSSQRPPTSHFGSSTVRLRIGIGPNETRAAHKICTRLAPGVILNRYEVIDFLGEGSMGQVYRVRDTALAREVALKYIRPKRLSITQTHQLLRREAQTMAQVEHAAVIRIYDACISAGELFVVMELARGGTLSRWVSVRSRSWREVITTFVKLGRGLAAAHHAGLIHCDIKPGNILFDEHGHPKIGDFGLACMAGSPPLRGHSAMSNKTNINAHNIRTIVIEGTLPYMAPEQLMGAPIDTRTDQFAFCVTLWEALCGKRPFQVLHTTLSCEAFLKSITHGHVDDPNPELRIPCQVLALIKRGLAAERSQRWRSMNELLVELDRTIRSDQQSRCPST